MDTNNIDLSIGRKNTPKTYIINNDVPLKEPVMECYIRPGVAYMSGVPKDRNVFNQRIIEAGSLEALMQKYPYVQLKINNSGYLEPAEPCNYNAVETNGYHVLYHHRKQKQQNQQQTKPVPVQPQVQQMQPTYGFAPINVVQAQQQPQYQEDSLKDHELDIVEGISFKLSDFVDLSDESKKEIYDPAVWKKAFHMEPEPDMHNVELRQHEFIAKDDEIYKYGLDNDKLSDNIVFQDVKLDHHPNPDYNKPTAFNNPYQNPFQTQVPTYEGMNPGIFNANRPPVTIPQDINNMEIPTPYTVSTQPVNPYPSPNYFQFVNGGTLGFLKELNQKTMQKVQQVNAQNPTRLETSNIVDFANPESVAMMQNPFGYQNGYANPNIKNQDPMHYNPYQNMNNAWWNNNNGMAGYNWYNTFNQINSNDFMVPTEEDYKRKNPFTARVSIVVNGKVVRKFYDESDEPKKEEKKKETCVDLLHKKIRTRVVTEIDGKLYYHGKETESWEKKNTAEVIPDDKRNEVSKSIEEKIVDKMQQVYDHMDQFEVPEESKLNWTDEDEDKLDHLAEEIAVYDKALAHAIYNAPVINGMTRETYEFYIKYIQKRLQEFRELEKNNPNIDYRLDYRYRRTPSMRISDNGKWIFNLIIPDYYPEKKYDSKGNRIYDYDRGSQPSKKEWNIFYAKAFAKIREEVNKLKADWILQFNIDKNNRKKGVYNVEGKEKKVTPLEHWRRTRDAEMESMKIQPTDTLWQRTVKEHDQMVANQKFVWMTLAGNRMTPDQFNEFWNGPQARTEDVDPYELHRRQVAQLTAQNLRTIQQAKPIDKRRFVEEAFKMEEEKMREWDKGVLQGCKTLMDVFDNLGYVVNLVHDDNVEQQRKAYNLKTTNQYSYKKSLIDWANSSRWNLENNTRPNTTFGPVDPKYGFPTNYVDLTKTDNYNECKKMFMDYCNKGTTDPVQPVYR